MFKVVLADLSLFCTRVDAARQELTVKYVNYARFCGSTCWFCAREFFNWYKTRMAQMTIGTNFAQAASTSNVPEQTDMATAVASACHDGAVLSSALADLALAVF